MRLTLLFLLASVTAAFIRPSLQGGVAATAQRLMSDYMSRLGPKPSGTDDERDEAKARARAITGRFSVYAPDANELDAKEFRRMIRVGLKIGKIDISDEDIEALIVALDDDGGGTLR